MRLISVRYRPVFDHLFSHFFSIVGSTIKIYSTTSGKIVSTLPGSLDEGHTDTITSAVLSPQNAFQLITASLDGTIKIWDFLEGVLLRTIGLDQPIHHVCTHEKIKDHLFVAAVKNKKSSQGSCESCQGSLYDRLFILISTRPSAAGSHQRSLRRELHCTPSIPQDARCD